MGRVGRRIEALSAKEHRINIGGIVPAYGGEFDSNAVKRTASFFAFIAALLIGSGSGLCASFTIGGPSAEATIRTDNTRALYASDKRGNVVLITEVGAQAPEAAGKFSELGVPQMAPDGRVLFAAETMVNDHHPHWDIFVGNPEAPLRDRVSHVLKPPAAGTDCLPQFKGDPYPVADANGAIAFNAPQVGGRDALFLYSGGRLECVARVGDTTNHGNVITVNTKMNSTA